MVDDKVGNRGAGRIGFLAEVEDLSVHEDSGVSAGGQADGAFGVRGAFAFCFAEPPFVFCEAWVVVGVNDGEFALCEWDSSEWAAEAEASPGEEY